MVLENLELIRLELNLPMLNLLFSDIIALFVIRNNTHQLYQLFNSYKILSAYKPKKKLHPKSYHFPIWLTRSQIGIGSSHLFLASQHQSGLLLSTSFSLQVPCWLLPVPTRNSKAKIEEMAIYRWTWFERIIAMFWEKDELIDPTKKFNCQF